MRRNFKKNILRCDPGIFPLSWLRFGMAVVVVAYAINFLFLGFLMSPFDYDATASFYEVAWRYWRYDTGLPSFNPLLCGGRPLGGDPQTPLFNPFLFLVPLLGAVWVVKIELLFQLMLGVLGLIWILDRWAMGVDEKWWAVFCYISGGGVVSRFLTGHVTLGYYLLLPLLLYYSYDAQEGKKGWGWFAKYWALIWYCIAHKPNFMIQALFPLCVECAVRSLLLRNYRPLLQLGVAGIVGVCLNLVTYLPAQAYFEAYPRIVDGIPNSTPLYTALLNLVLPLKTLPERLYGPHYMPRHEYNVFVGVVPLLLALRLVATRFKGFGYIRPELWSLVVWAVVSLVLGLGSASEQLSLISPYSWLYRWWPGFQSVRVPPRFWYAVYLSVILFSSLAFRVRLPGPGHLWAVMTVVPLVLSAVVNLSKVTASSSVSTLAGPAHYDPQFSWVTTRPDDNYAAIRRGRGALNCHYNMNIPQAKLEEGPAISAVLSGENRIYWANWSQITLDWEHPDRRALTFNINHAPFWSFSGVGAKIVSKDAQALTLELMKPPLRGKLVYQLPLAHPALYFSLACLVLVMVVLGVLFIYDIRL